MDTSTNLLTLDGAAARLAMSTETIRRYVRAGKLKAYIVGNRYRIEPSEVESFIRKGIKANGTRAAQAVPA